MSSENTTSLVLNRSSTWRWWVCGLLLLATMINYMDRLTLNLLASTINTELGLTKLQYARIEVAFAIAFALGAIAFGFIVDRWNVFWVYPLAVLAWSAAGVFSGLAQGFLSLMVCRFFLALAESANWPCALRTTQRILPPADRTMGNSILQSGAALGAILIPLVLLALFDSSRPETWRIPFYVVGAAGALWVFLWWGVLRPSDLALPSAGAIGAAKHLPPPLPTGLFVRRFIALIVMVVTINMTWHFLRAWFPLFLKEEHGYSQEYVNWFASAYYIFADVGALTAGFVTLRLARSGLSVHTSRRIVFLSCALLVLCCVAAAFMPKGWALLGLLLVTGFASLGAFPNYYSFSQDLTVRHQGKVTGTLGCCCWIAMAALQETVGQIVQRTGSYLPGFLIAGLAPLVGFIALTLLWGPVEEHKKLDLPPDDQFRPPSSGTDDGRIQSPNEGIQGDVRAVQPAKG